MASFLRATYYLPQILPVAVAGIVIVGKDEAIVLIGADRAFTAPAGAHERLAIERDGAGIGLEQPGDAV